MAQSTPLQSYSSGMGGYNKADYPTFSPAPYTFASNIYGQQNPTPNMPPMGGYGPNLGYMAPPPQFVQPPGPYGYPPMNNNQDTCSFQ